MTDLSREQDEAVQRIEVFLAARRPERAWFSLQGLAGTGKSFTLAEIARRHPGAILCAPTGKAASVLARKSGLEATTIHSAIYNFRGEYVDERGERFLSFQQKINDGSWHRRVALVDEFEYGGRLAGAGPAQHRLPRGGDRRSWATAAGARDALLRPGRLHAARGAPPGARTRQCCARPTRCAPPAPTRRTGTTSG